MFSEILVPTDGSVGATRGVDHALDIAAAYDARVHALFVVDEEIYGTTPALSGDELFLEEIQEQGEAACAEICAMAADRGLDAVSHCVRGRPYYEIIDYTERNGIDLIVMGRHGAADHRHHHIGSCTDRVVRLADVPVMPV